MKNNCVFAECIYMYKKKKNISSDILLLLLLQRSQALYKS